MAKQGNFQYVPFFIPEFNPIKDRKKLDPPQWKDFDRRGKEKERAIRKQAEQDADFGIPSGEHWSDTENEILADANEYQHKLADIGSEYFTELENRINSYSDFLSLENFKTFYRNLTTNTQDCIDRAKLKLSQLQSVHKRHVEDYERFKKINRLKRMPSPVSTQKFFLQFGIVFILFVVEVAINNFLVADYLEGGGLESIALTVGVAFINVFISLAIGYYFLKYITHINISARIAAVFALVLHITLFFYMNWMYSAFRTQKVMEFEETNANITLENISVLMPWTVDIQFTSLILLFIGFVFAVLSLIDGYLLDDPYPNYGKIARTYNKSRKDIEVKLNKLVFAMQEIFNGIHKESEEMRTTLMLTINAWSEETNSFQNGFDLYKKKILSAEKDINHMLEEYMIANKDRRDKTKYPLPERLKNTSPFLYTDDQRNPHKVFKTSIDVYMEDATRREKRKKLQEEVEESFNIFTKQVEEFRKKMLITIEEAQKEYEPA